MKIIDAIKYWEDFKDEAIDMLLDFDKNSSTYNMLQEQINVCSFTIEELHRLNDFCE